MARLNQVIKAFDPDELKMLAQIVEHEEKRAAEEGYILPDPFQELKYILQSANRYTKGFSQEHE